MMVILEIKKNLLAILLPIICALGVFNCLGQGYVIFENIHSEGLDAPVALTPGEG